MCWCVNRKNVGMISYHEKTLRARSFLQNSPSVGSVRKSIPTLLVVDIINGAAYLFDKEPDIDDQYWKADLELEQFRKVLDLEDPAGAR